MMLYPMSQKTRHSTLAIN